jgi:hypothetical protein
LIRESHSGLEGRCLALSDWWTQLRLIEQEIALEAKMPAAAEAGRADGREADGYFLSE